MVPLAAPGRVLEMGGGQVGQALQGGAGFGMHWAVDAVVYWVTVTG